MTSSVKFQGKEVVLPNNVLTFNYDVQNVGVLNDRVIVLLNVLENKSAVLDNVYAYRLLDGEFLWQSQSVSEKYPNLADLMPYVHIAYYDGEVHATDYMGRNFAINPADGKILGFTITK